MGGGYTSDPTDLAERESMVVPPPAERPLHSLFDFATKQIRPIFAEGKYFASGMSVSPNGRWILYSLVAMCSFALLSGRVMTATPPSPVEITTSIEIQHEGKFRPSRIPFFSRYGSAGCVFLFLILFFSVAAGAML